MKVKLLKIKIQRSYNINIEQINSLHFVIKFNDLN